MRLKLDTFNSEERGTAEEEPMYQWSLTSNLRREIGKKTVYQYGGSWKIWMYFRSICDGDFSPVFWNMLGSDWYFLSRSIIIPFNGLKMLDPFFVIELVCFWTKWVSNFYNTKTISVNKTYTLLMIIGKSFVFYFYPHLHINCVAPPCFSASQDKVFAYKTCRQCG